MVCGGGRRDRGSRRDERHRGVRLPKGPAIHSGTALLRRSRATNRRSPTVCVHSGGGGTSSREPRLTCASLFVGGTELEAGTRLQGTQKKAEGKTSV